MSPRNSRQSTSSSGSRRSNRTSNPNVFSDEYALEPLDTYGNSPFDADDDPTSTSTSPSLHTAPSSISRPISPNSTTSTSRQPSSISHKPLGFRDVVFSTPHRTASSASNTFSDINRASSTSSHFSMPRSQSPYVGATGPSHPYGMYPQITRTSSIASASTVRPVERPFVAPSGPEHPYAMYSQNTVPEEDDVALAHANIPLGFPGMGQQYQMGAQTRRDDIADIVGSDGHIEELPPYSRYADDMAPKERPQSMHSVTVPTLVAGEVATSPEISRTQFLDDGAELNSPGSRTTESDSSGSFKEKIKRKSRQRVCGGLPFWFIFVIIGVLVLGVILGAIIGGVVGRKKGVVSSAGAESFQNSSVATATVTSTAFIDGTPLPTDHPIPDVPNGQYNVPTNNIGVISQGCIPNTDLSNAWMCMPPLGIGITILGQRQNAALILDPYPINASFMYGAQPPDLNGRPLTLAPSLDLDSNDLGASLFAWTYHDKLTILHEEDLQPNGNYKRDPNQNYGRAGDKPWFCWFNQTVLEVFIYVNKPRDSSTTTSIGVSSSPSTASSTLIPSSSTNSPFPPIPPITSSINFPIPSFPPSAASFLNDINNINPFTASSYHNKRETTNDGRRNPYVNYPLLMKIEEKRKPSGNVQPYCQQMQILDNLDIVPIGTVAQIPVPEEGSMDDLIFNRIRRRDWDQQGCTCEWMSG